MPAFTTLHELGAPAGTALALTLAALALVVSEPLLGRRQHRRFLAEVAAGGEAARLRFYRTWIAQAWAYAAATVLLVAALPGVGPEDLGLRAHDLAAQLGRFASSDMAAGLVGGLLGGALLFVVVARRRQRLPMPGGQAIDPMLPRSGRGRWGWAALAVTAGVTEEITFRGLLVLAIALIAPGAPAAAVIAVAATFFGVAHWYQGPWGMLATGVLGALLTGVYLLTGSLLVPMALHALIDLRPLVLSPRGEASRLPASGETT